MDSDQHGRHATEVLGVADTRLGNGDDQPGREWILDHVTVGVLGAKAPQQRNRDPDRAHHGDPVDPGNGADRDVEPLGPLVAGVRSSTRHERTGDERKARQSGDQPDADRGPPGDDRDTLGVVGIARADDEHDAQRDERHRQQEVLLICERVEIAQHDDRADESLHRDAERDHDREASEVGPARAALDRPEHGGHDDHHHHAGEQTVDLLDRAVRRRDVDQLLRVAVRPVGAAKSGPAEPHRRTSDNDHAHGHQRRNADLAVGGGTHRRNRRG